MSWTAADRTTLTAQATEQILRQIKDGTFKAGDRLPSQRELSRAMDVGISAIREALQRLEMLGVLEVRQGQNAVVRPVGHEVLFYDPELFLVAAEKESLPHVFEARETLEITIAGLAAQRATPEDVEAIRRALEREATEDPADYETHRRLNNAFHLAVASASHNPVLIGVLRPLLRSWRVLGSAYRPDLEGQWRRLHRAIYEAVSDHDPEAAQQAMRAHMALTADFQKRAMDSESAAADGK